MKRLLPLLALLWCVPLVAQTPTWKYHTQQPEIFSGSGIINQFTGNLLKLSFPQVSASGDTIVVGARWGNTGTRTLAVTDDKSNSYTCTTRTINGNSVYKETCWSIGVAAGTRVVTMTFSGGPPPHIGAGGDMFYNIASMDVNCNSNSAAATTLGSCALTTTAGGDLLYQDVQIDDITQSAPVTITPGSGFTLTGVTEITGSTETQYKVLGAAGSYTASMTSSSTQSYNSWSVAFKAGANGSAPPAGLNVISAQSENYDDTGTTNTPIVKQFPCTGDGALLVWMGGPGEELTSVTDSSSNTWTIINATPITNGGSGNLTFARAYRPTCTNALKVTMNFNVGNMSGSSAIFLDMSGTANPFLDSTTCSGAGFCFLNAGSQASAGTLTTTVITPSTSTGVLVNAVTIESHNISPATCTPGSFDPVDENNAPMHFYTTTTSAQTFTCTTTGGGAGPWVSMAIAILAASAPAGPPANQFPRVIGW